MLRCIYSKRTTRFLAPDDGGGTGGGDDGKQQQQTIATPFDNIKWDELDDETKTHLEQAKADFVATSQQSAKLKVDFEHQAGLARRFQSEADRAKAELDKVTGRSQQQDADPILTVVKDKLKAANYSEEDVAKLSPVFAAMFKDVGQVQRAQLGRDLAPLAGSVLTTEATNAFNMAKSNDPMGMLSDNIVAEQVWTLVQDRVSKGLETNADIVLNFAKMAWMDQAAAKIQKGEKVEFAPTSSTPPGMIAAPAKFTFPGAGANGLTPAFTRVPDPNAARTTLNEDTQNALAETFAALGTSTGLRPKAFPAKKSGGSK